MVIIPIFACNENSRQRLFLQNPKQQIAQALQVRFDIGGDVVVVVDLVQLDRRRDLQCFSGSFLFKFTKKIAETAMELNKLIILKNQEFRQISIQPSQYS